MKRLSVPPDLLVVGVTTLAAFAVWSSTDGGYAEVVWYPVGIILLLLAVMLVWSAPWRRLGHRSLIAAAGLVGYTAWSFLSIIWAGDRGLALTGANRTLTYLLVFVVVLGRRPSGWQAVSWAAAWAVSTVTVGIVAFATAAYAAHPTDSFIGGRLAVPIDYANANAALFLLAAWPLLVIAASAAVPALARALALAVAGVALELAVLAQSKGGALATAAVVCVLLVVLRRRMRIVVPMVLVAATIAVVHHQLFDLYTRVGDDDRPGAAARSALWAIIASFVALVLAGLLMSIIDGRLKALSPKRARILNACAAAIVVVCLVAGISVGIARYGSPVSIVSRGWHAFKYPPSTTTTSSHFLSSAGNHRYDFWRVAAHQLTTSPLVGAGTDNFATDYLKRRQSSEEPLYPHSLEARLLGGTGIVGFLLFAVFAVAAASLAVGAARSSLPGRSTVGAIGVAVFAYWLAHGSVDWLWEFPALTGPAFAVLACAAAFDEPRAKARQVLVRPVRAAVVTATALAAGCALAPAWLAARDTSLGVAVWRTSPTTAYARLTDAARLNRLSDQPYVLAGTVAERRRDWPRVEQFFTSALERTDDNWYSRLELGIAQAMTGKVDSALANLSAARRLDPQEPIIREVQRDVQRRNRIAIGALDQAMVERTGVRRGH